MNKIYKEMYQNKLFTLAEANKIIKDYQVCRNTLSRLAKDRMIVRLKAGIYYIMPLDNQEFYPNPIHIASKLRDEAVISASSALKALKLMEHEESTIYISATHPTKLRIGKNTHRIVKGYNFGIDKIDYQTSYGTIQIKTTDIERTIIDCLKTRSVKGIELIRILKTKPVIINMKKILNYLEKYDMPILYSKVGVILDASKSNLKIEDSDLEKIRKKLTKKINYFKERDIKLIRPRYHYLKEWNIMLPEHLFELVKPPVPQQTA